MYAHSYLYTGLCVCIYIYINIYICILVYSMSVRALSCFSLFLMYAFALSLSLSQSLSLSLYLHSVGFCITWPRPHASTIHVRIYVLTCFTLRHPLAHICRCPSTSFHPYVMHCFRHMHSKMPSSGHPGVLRPYCAHAIFPAGLHRSQELGRRQGIEFLFGTGPATPPGVCIVGLNALRACTCSVVINKFRSGFHLLVASLLF